MDPQNIHVSPGTKMMIFACIQAVVDPGDEVISADPGYPAYEAAVRMAGGIPVMVPADEAESISVHGLDDVKRRITAHQADHHQLAAEPDWRRFDAEGFEGLRTSPTSTIC